MLDGTVVRSLGRLIWARVCAATIVLEGTSIPFGPSTGGTVVTVTGSHLLAGAVCRFGTAVVAGTVDGGGSTIVCTAPSRGTTTGPVTLEVSNNNAQFTDYGFVFEYGTCALLPCRSVG